MSLRNKAVRYLQYMDQMYSESKVLLLMCNVYCRSAPGGKQLDIEDRCVVIRLWVYFRWSIQKRKKTFSL